MIKQKELAKQFGITVGMISHLKLFRRYTTNRYLAMEVARLSGKPPIEHISPELRDVFIRAFPELSRKMQ